MDIVVVTSYFCRGRVEAVSQVCRNKKTVMKVTFCGKEERKEAGQRLIASLLERQKAEQEKS